MTSWQLSSIGWLASDVNADRVLDFFLRNEDQVSAASGSGELPPHRPRSVTFDDGADILICHVRKHCHLSFKGLGKERS